MNDKSTHMRSNFGNRGAENADLPKALVQFENVSLKYNNSIAEKNRNLALDKVSLRLERGGFYFLTGPSGAGKSTLLKLMYLALSWR